MKNKRQMQSSEAAVFTARYSSPLGIITLAGGESLCGLWFDGQKYFAASLPLRGDKAEEKALPIFAQASDWLDRYFAGEKPSPAELPLSPGGTPFQRTVWKQLLEIPYGETVSYGTIARRIAVETGRASLSAQAVGGAIGHNPISIIIPCHRVIGAQGSLTGYAGGLERKRALLLLERDGAEAFARIIQK